MSPPPVKVQKVEDSKKENIPPAILQYLTENNLLNINDLKMKLGPKPIAQDEGNHSDSAKPEPKPELQPEPQPAPKPAPKPAAKSDSKPQQVLSTNSVAKNRYQYKVSDHAINPQSNHNVNNAKKSV